MEINDSELLNRVIPLATCSKCQKIPLFTLASPKVLTYQCNCSIKRYIDVSDFVNGIKILKNPYCVNNKSHGRGVEYCTLCRIWLCNNCLLIHKPLNHNILKVGANIQPTCEMHLFNKNEYFCIKCEKHICSICYENHKDHNVINFDRFYRSKEVNYIIENFEKAKRKVYIIDEKIKKEIDLIEKDLNSINTSYENYKEVNHNLLKYFHILLTNYNSIKSIPEINAIENIIQNSTFNLNEFNNSNSIPLQYRIKNMISYFNNNYIISPKVDLIRGKCVNEIKNHFDCIRNIIILKSGNIASCSDDQTIKIYNNKSYNCICTLDGHQDKIHYITQLNNGQLISCAKDKTIKIWELDKEKGVCIQTINDAHIKSISKVVELRKNGFASCSYDTIIKLWKNKDVEKYQCANILEGHSNSVLSIIVLRDGRLLSGAYDNTIRIWDVEKNKKESMKVIKKVKCSDSNSLIQVDDNRVISGGYNSISVINVNKMEITKQCELNNVGKICALLILRNGSLLCGCGEDLYHFDSNINFLYKLTKAHNGTICTLISIGNEIFLSGSWDSTIKVWEY